METTEPCPRSNKKKERKREREREIEKGIELKLWMLLEENGRDEDWTEASRDEERRTKNGCSILSVVHRVMDKVGVIDGFIY